MQAILVHQQREETSYRRTGKVVVCNHVKVCARYVHSYYPVPENLRNRSVRYGKEIIGDNSCQDDNIVSEKEPSLDFDCGERQKDYGRRCTFRSTEHDGERRNVSNLPTSEW